MASAADADLDALDLPADRPVGIRARKSPQAIALILACLKAAPPVPAAVGRARPETLDQLFAQADASRVLTPRTTRSGRQGRAPASGRRGDEPASSGRRRGGDDISFMLTTSGSTGLPKIVPLPAARSTASPTGREQFEIGPGATVLNYAPLNFDLCLLDIWTTLKHGGCVVLVDQDRGDERRATSPT